MCNFFSCVLVHEDFFGLGNKLKVFYDSNENSHEAIIRNNHLNDTTIKNRKFIRFEITPKGSLFDMNRGNWKFKIDEAKTIPSWYENNIERCDKLVWSAWGEMMMKVNAVLTDPLTKNDYKEYIAIIDKYDKLKNRELSEEIVAKLSEAYHSRNGSISAINSIFYDYCKEHNILSLFDSIGSIESAYTVEDNALIGLRNDYKDRYIEMINILEGNTECVNSSVV